MPMSNKEQAQIVKTWWKEYGIYILSTVIFFIVVNIGWKFWKRYNQYHQANASVLYMQMITAGDSQQTEEKKLFAEKLVNDYSKSIYGSFAGLTLAKDAVEAGDLQEAEKNLQLVIKKSPDKDVKQIARIRAARVLIAMDKPKEALDLLNTVNDKNYEGEVSEVFGDGLLALGRTDEAQKAYQKAKQLNSDKKVESPLLKMKMQQF